MSNSRTRPQNRVLRLILIEDDPVFRLGLVACLEPFADLQVVLEADSTTRALQLLRDLVAAPDTIVPNTIAEEIVADQNAEERSARSLALIILNLDLGQATSSHGAGLRLCQRLRADYPQFPLLLLGSTLELTRLAVAFQLGAGGYCLKGTGVAALVTAIRQVAAGQPYWAEGIQAIAASSANAQLPDAASLVQRSTVSNSLTEPPTRQSWLARQRQNLRLSGVRQIEQAIAALDAQRQANPSLIDQLFLAGQRRELRTAHWLVNWLLAASEPEPLLQASPPDARSALESNQIAESAVEPASGKRQAAFTPVIASSSQPPQAALFLATVTKLQANLQNLTGTALEIDILKDTKKRELLYLVLRQLQNALDALRLQLPLEQLGLKREAILHDLWQATVTDFFGKYYTLQTGTQSIEVVNVLLQDRDIVQSAILDRIPLVPEFLSHLLFQTPLTIDGVDYAAGTVEAMARMELLLQHLIIQTANAVMQPLINRFGDVVAIKQAFYDQRLLSSREIERFRNDLSWKYRIDRLFAEPTAIFESQYPLLTLTENGISKTTIYAPRNDELAALSGIPFLIILVLETRDAIAPRVRAAVSFFGRGVVYVLTEIIGRGIGLIGRGVIKGIGNALQDPKSKRSERWR
jgi:DNA-binding NarL/FixJ family response regulator